jgi:hypothetical protein
MSKRRKPERDSNWVPDEDEDGNSNYYNNKYKQKRTKRPKKQSRRQERQPTPEDLYMTAINEAEYEVQLAQAMYQSVLLTPFFENNVDYERRKAKAEAKLKAALQARDKVQKSRPGRAAAAGSYGPAAAAAGSYGSAAAAAGSYGSAATGNYGPAAAAAGSYGSAAAGNYGPAAAAAGSSGFSSAAAAAAAGGNGSNNWERASRLYRSTTEPQRLNREKRLRELREEQAAIEEATRQLDGLMRRWQTLRRPGDDWLRDFATRQFTGTRKPSAKNIEWLRALNSHKNSNRATYDSSPKDSVIDGYVRRMLGREEGAELTLKDWLKAQMYLNTFQASGTGYLRNLVRGDPRFFFLLNWDFLQAASVRATQQIDRLKKQK